MSPASRARPTRARPAGRSGGTSARRGRAAGRRSTSRKTTQRKSAPRQSTARRRARGRTAEIRTRRGRLLLAAAGLFALVVMATGMPVSALLTQHRQLATASAELSQLQNADRTLSQQARALADSSTVSGLARSEYGLVPNGQKAYVVLPPSNASAAVVAGSGHVPLEGPPVEPGSAQSEALLGVAGSTPAATAGSPGRSSSQRTPTAPHGSSSFWGRMLHSLEFWR